MFANMKWALSWVFWLQSWRAKLFHFQVYFRLEQALQYKQTHKEANFTMHLQYHLTWFLIRSNLTFCFLYAYWMLEFLYFSYQLFLKSALTMGKSTTLGTNGNQVQILFANALAHLPLHAPWFCRALITMETKDNQVIGGSKTPQLTVPVLSTVLCSASN